MINTVVFDLFGTLVDIFSRTKYQGVLADMAQALDLPESAFRDAWYKSSHARAIGQLPTCEASVREVLRMLALQRTEEAISKAVHTRLSFVREHLMWPRPDAIPTVQALKKREHDVALLSNCAPEVAEVWDQTPLAQHISACFLSCRVGVAKPSEEFFAHAVTSLGTSSQNCLYVGDGDDYELEAATAAGMKAVQIRVAYEDPVDAFRKYDGVWNGLKIQQLAEVTDLVN